MSPESTPGKDPVVTEPHAVHHRVHLLSMKGAAGESLALPPAFSSPVRPDLIRRAVVAAQSARIQPHSTSPTAGRRHSVEWSGKGRGVARTPRLMESMRGAQAPNTVGGGLAHPPRIDTIWRKKINGKERRLAFASALAATREPALLKARGHVVPEGLHLPVVVEDPIETVLTAADARRFLNGVKLWDEVERVHDGVHVRAGRGKRRGRFRRSPTGLLVVTSAPGKARGFQNLSGVNVVPVGRLGTEDLAPGGDAGRLTIFSQAALAALASRLGGGTA